MNNAGTKSITTSWVIESPVPEFVASHRVAKHWLIEHVWVAHCSRCGTHTVFEEDQFEGMPHMNQWGDEIYAFCRGCDEAIQKMLSDQISPYYRAKPCTIHGEN